MHTWTWVYFCKKAVFIFGHYVWFVTLVSPDFSKLTGRTHAQSICLLQLTETVASQFERCDDAPFFRPLQKSSTSRDSVTDVTAGEGTRSSTPKGTEKQEKASKEDTKTEEELSRKESKDERKESKEERRDAAKDDRKEKGDSLPRGVDSGECMLNSSVKSYNDLLQFK